MSTAKRTQAKPTVAAKKRVPAKKAPRAKPHDCCTGTRMVSVLGTDGSTSAWPL